MRRMAIIETATNTVQVVVGLPDGSPWQPPEGRFMAEAPEDIWPGALYDPGSGTFAALVDGQPRGTQMTRAEFIRRLGPQRLAAILAAAQQSPDVLYFVELTRNAEYIDPAEAVPGLEALEAAEVLPEGTAAEIFD